MERLVDAAAREIGIDPVELRRRNQIAAGRTALHATPVGTTYDSGDFPGLLARRGRGCRLGRLSGAPGCRAATPASCAAAASAAILEVTAPPAERDGRHPFRGRRHGHHRHRHARLRPGPLDAAGAAPDEPARRSVRAHPPGAGRQRPADRGRRHRRFEVDHGERVGGDRGERARRRKGPQGRGPRSRSRRGRHRVLGRPLHHRRNGPGHRHHGSRRAPARRAPLFPPTFRVRSTSTTSTRRRRRRFRTAATSPRSRSIPRPGSPKSCGTRWSTISGRS